MTRSVPYRYRYPVLFMEIDAADPAYARGYRYRVEDVDRSITWLASRERAEGHLRIHALEPISPERMEVIRRLVLESRSAGE